MMKEAILISLVAGAAAGAGTAILTSTLHQAAEGGGGPASSAALSPDSTGDTLSDQVAALVRENKQLVERVGQLETRLIRASTASAPTRAPASVAAEVPNSLEDRLAAIEAAVSVRDGVVPKNLPAAIQDTLAELEAQKQREEEQQRVARRIERTDERIAELTRQLGMNPSQANLMRGILLDETTKREELMFTLRDGGGGGDRGNMREVFTTMRDETNARVAAVLAPDQYAKYLEENQGFGRGAFGGGGGGGRGGRDGGGDERRNRDTNN